MLVLHNADAQFAPGTYRIIDEPVNSLSGRLFSQLIIKHNTTFTYKYLTSASCFLWYDITGSWYTAHDTLCLTDTVLSHHWVVRFPVYHQTDSGSICITVKSKKGMLLQGIKILYIFKNSKDTLCGFTGSNGKMVVDTKSRAGLNTTGGHIIDDVEIWVVYFTKDGRDQTTNSFCKLSCDIDCEIDDDAKSELMIRKTMYKISGSKLGYLSQVFNKRDPNPLRHLFGDFEFQTSVE